MCVFSACEHNMVQYLHAQIKVFSAHKASTVTFQGQELFELPVTSNKTVGPKAKLKNVTSIGG